MTLKNYKPSNGFNEGKPESRTYGDDDFNEGQPQSRTYGDDDFNEGQPKSRTYGDDDFNEGQPKSRTYGDDDFNEGQPKSRTYADISGSEDFFNEPSDVTPKSGRITPAFPAAIFNPNHEDVPSLLTRIIARVMKTHVPSDIGRGSRNLFPVYSVFIRNEKDNSLEQLSTSSPNEKRRPMRNPVFMKHVRDTDFSNPYYRRQRERESHLNEVAMNFLMKLRRFLSVKYAS